MRHTYGEPKSRVEFGLCESPHCSPHTFSVGLYHLMWRLSPLVTKQCESREQQQALRFDYLSRTLSHPLGPTFYHSSLFLSPLFLLSSFTCITLPHSLTLSICIYSYTHSCDPPCCRALFREGSREQMPSSCALLLTACQHLRVPVQL